jgi:hypothetical protein
LTAAKSGTAAPDFAAHNPGYADHERLSPPVTDDNGKLVSIDLRLKEFVRRNGRRAIATATNSDANAD